jgi:glycolate dehydrogenase FAD-binding subunit
MSASTRRPSTPADTVDGILPRFLVEPSSADDLSETIADLARERQSLVIRGAGTKLEWGRPPEAADVLLSTTRLNQVVAHRHGDLTVTVQTGASLADVNRQLATRRQWIPLDPPFGDRATIGGIVATNDSGPRRHRYGAPRDLIIGVEFVRADGKPAKGGGIVVKNVAGYDLPRLMTGSFGSLAVMTTATFKLFPLAPSSATVVAELDDPASLGTIVQKLLGSHLTPTALEFETPPLRLMVRFESIEAAVEQQSEHASELLRECGFASKTFQTTEEAAAWDRHGSSVFHGDGAVVKITTLPTDLPGILAKLAGRPTAGAAGVGVFSVRVDGNLDAQASVVGEVRSHLAPGRGSAVVRRGSRELRKRIDAWGPMGDGLALMRAVKQQFDPAGLLNPGRGPAGL